MRQCNALKLHSGYANMWYERHPYKMEIVGSTPTLTTSWRSGVRVASADLKSAGPKGPCEFESHLRYKD